MTPAFKIVLGTHNAKGDWYQVTLATRIAQRCRGLIGLEPLSEKTGLLLWPGGSVHTFGMRYPIDVLFLDADLRVLAQKRALQPWRIARAPLRTRGTLELAAHASQRITVGHQFYPVYGDSYQCLSQQSDSLRFF